MTKKYLLITYSDHDCQEQLTCTPMNVKFEDFKLEWNDGFYLENEDSEVLCWFYVRETIKNFKNSGHVVSAFDKYCPCCPLFQDNEEPWMKLLVAFSFSPLKGCLFGAVYRWNDGKLQKYDNKDSMAVGNFSIHATCQKDDEDVFYDENDEDEKEPYDIYLFSCGGQEG